MDAKDLRTEAVLGDRSSDGNVKYAQGGAALPCNRTKPYQDIGSNSLAKVDVQAARPFAVIGPDRVVPPAASSDAYLKKGPVEQWLSSDNAYRQPPDYPHKSLEYQHPARNISPRQTFQENMQRIMVPSYNSVKLKEDHNFPIDANTPPIRNNKFSLPTDSKYCDVPYPVNNAMTNEQKTTRNPEMSVPNMNLNRGMPHAWPSNSASVRPPKPYGAPDLYQYPEYPSCAGPRPVLVPRPHRTMHEEVGHMYPDPYTQDGSIRFKPYPTVKERFSQPRYDYIANYSNAYHPPPPFPTHKYEVQRPTAPHPYPGYPQVPIKYLDSRMPEPIINGYPRPNPQAHFGSAPFRNQVIHPTYGPVPGNCIQTNKYFPYQQESLVKQSATNKLPYDPNNKAFTESFYVNDIARTHSLKGNVLPPNYPGNIYGMPPHPYYRRESQPMKGYEFSPHLRNIDPSITMSIPSMSRFSSQFPLTNIANSPSDSNTSNDTNLTQGTSHDDSGYVSQSSSVSMRSMDSTINRVPYDTYRRYDHRYNSMMKTPMIPKYNTTSSAGSKDKKDIDVRQFLQMWNEGEDENAENNIPQESNIHMLHKAKDIGSSYESNNQEQLYVLGLVNVPSEELSKYEHIQKVSKLPENIKGYNSIELLHQFEEVIESSNLNHYTAKPPPLRSFDTSIKGPSATSLHAIGIPARPLSPLDVEAKISQSVIHKDVGCNFEIKPCSPKMMNVEIAAPVHSILGERVIEKVTNPLVVHSPTLSNANDNKIKSQDNVSSCKMIHTQFSNNDNEGSVKTNYSLHDLESNSGVCLASLPRLDNDIELSFPEVNQQFINANKVESVIINAAKDLPSLEGHPEIKEPPDHPEVNDPVLQELDQCKVKNDFENDLSKLSKYRKFRQKSSDSKDLITAPSVQALRTDSVIIKNPENVKNQEETFDCLPKTINTQQDPINLTVTADCRSPEFCNEEDQDSMPNINNELALDFSLNSSEHCSKVDNHIIKPCLSPKQTEDNSGYHEHLDRVIDSDFSKVSKMTNDAAKHKTGQSSSSECVQANSENSFDVDKVFNVEESNICPQSPHIPTGTESSHHTQDKPQIPEDTNLDSVQKLSKFDENATVTAKRVNNIEKYAWTKNTDTTKEQGNAIEKCTSTETIVNFKNEVNAVEKCASPENIDFKKEVNADKCVSNENIDTDKQGNAIEESSSLENINSVKAVNAVEKCGLPENIDSENKVHIVKKYASPENKDSEKEVNTAEKWASTEIIDSVKEVNAVEEGVLPENIDTENEVHVVKKYASPEIIDSVKEVDTVEKCASPEIINSENEVNVVEKYASTENLDCGEVVNAVDKWASTNSEKEDNVVEKYASSKNLYSEKEVNAVDKWPSTESFLDDCDELTTDSSDINELTSDSSEKDEMTTDSSEKDEQTTDSPEKEVMAVENLSSTENFSDVYDDNSIIRKTELIAQSLEKQVKAVVRCASTEDFFVDCDELRTESSDQDVNERCASTESFSDNNYEPTTELSTKEVKAKERCAWTESFSDKHNEVTPAFSEKDFNVVEECASPERFSDNHNKVTTALSEKYVNAVEKYASAESFSDNHDEVTTALSEKYVNAVEKCASAESFSDNHDKVTTALSEKYVNAVEECASAKSFSDNQDEVTTALSEKEVNAVEECASTENLSDSHDELTAELSEKNFTAAENCGTTDNFFDVRDEVTSESLEKEVTAVEKCRSTDSFLNVRNQQIAELSEKEIHAVEKCRMTENFLDIHDELTSVEKCRMTKSFLDYRVELTSALEREEHTIKECKSSESFLDIRDELTSESSEKESVTAVEKCASPDSLLENHDQIMITKSSEKHAVEKCKITENLLICDELTSEIPEKEVNAEEKCASTESFLECRDELTSESSEKESVTAVEKCASPDSLLENHDQIMITKSSEKHAVEKCKKTENLLICDELTSEIPEKEVNAEEKCASTESFLECRDELTSESSEKESVTAVEICALPDSLLEDHDQMITESSEKNAVEKCKITENLLIRDELTSETPEKEVNVVEKCASTESFLECRKDLASESSERESVTAVEKCASPDSLLEDSDQMTTELSEKHAVEKSKMTKNFIDIRDELTSETPEKEVNAVEKCASTESFLDCRDELITALEKEVHTVEECTSTKSFLDVHDELITESSKKEDNSVEKFSSNEILLDVHGELTTESLEKEVHTVEKRALTKSCFGVRDELATESSEKEVHALEKCKLAKNVLEIRDELTSESPEKEVKAVEKCASTESFLDCLDVMTTESSDKEVHAIQKSVSTESFLDCRYESTTESSDKEVYALQKCASNESCYNVRNERTTESSEKEVHALQKCASTESFSITASLEKGVHAVENCSTIEDCRDELITESLEKGVHAVEKCATIEDCLNEREERTTWSLIECESVQQKTDLSVNDMNKKIEKIRIRKVKSKKCDKNRDKRHKHKSKPQEVKVSEETGKINKATKTEADIKEKKIDGIFTLSNLEEDLYGLKDCKHSVKKSLVFIDEHCLLPEEPPERKFINSPKDQNTDLLKSLTNPESGTYQSFELPSIRTQSCPEKTQKSKYFICDPNELIAQPCNRVEKPIESKSAFISEASSFKRAKYNSISETCKSYESQTISTQPCPEKKRKSKYFICDPNELFAEPPDRVEELLERKHINISDHNTYLEKSKDNQVRETCKSFQSQKPKYFICDPNELFAEPPSSVQKTLKSNSSEHLRKNDSRFQSLSIVNKQQNIEMSAYPESDRKKYISDYFSNELSQMTCIFSPKNKCEEVKDVNNINEEVVATNFYHEITGERKFKKELFSPTFQKLILREGGCSVAEFSNIKHTKAIIEEPDVVYSHKNVAQTPLPGPKSPLLFDNISLFRSNSCDLKDHLDDKSSPFRNTPPGRNDDDDEGSKTSLKVQNNTGRGNNTDWRSSSVASLIKSEFTDAADNLNIACEDRPATEDMKELIIEQFPNKLSTANIENSECNSLDVSLVRMGSDWSENRLDESDVSEKQKSPDCLRSAQNYPNASNDNVKFKHQANSSNSIIEMRNDSVLLDSETLNTIPKKLMNCDSSKKGLTSLKETDSILYHCSFKENDSPSANDSVEAVNAHIKPTLPSTQLKKDEFYVCYTELENEQTTCSVQMESENESTNKVSVTYDDSENQEHLGDDGDELHTNVCVPSSCDFGENKSHENSCGVIEVVNELLLIQEINSSNKVLETDVTDREVALSYDNYDNIDSPGFATNLEKVGVEHISPALAQYKDIDQDKKVQYSNNCRRNKKRIYLKRSLSESALDDVCENMLGSENKPLRIKKRRKVNDFEDLTESHFLTESNCNVTQNNRRNSISSIYNEENVSFCILIDNNCILEEDEEETEKICYAEIAEECLPCIEDNSINIMEESSEVLDDARGDIAYESEINCSSFVPYMEEENSIEESWVDDVACVETVVSQDIAEDITITESMSPKNDSDSESYQEDIDDMYRDHTNKVKYIYGDTMCSDDAHLVETLYRTPQKDVNRTLINRESELMIEENRYYDKESLEKVLSEPNTAEIVSKPSCEKSDLNFSLKEIHIPTSDLENPKDNYVVKKCGRQDDKRDVPSVLEQVQDYSIDLCESSGDNVFSYVSRHNSSNCVASSSPEVSSTTSEERNAGLLLKITNYNGSRISEINDINPNKRLCCKYTEDKEYNLSSRSNLPSRPLITKAAQKYIPPLKESIRDLKVQLPLPQHSLIKLKELKVAKEIPKPSPKSCKPLHKKDIAKKPKPKFEDVLKSIDEIQIQKHKQSKKVKKAVPKVVIKKNGNGSHYASTSNPKDKYNPDLTGRKWQPWVFIERNNFIDKMAKKNKTRAIFSYRKNEYVLAENFRKYKSISTAKFVISQPSSDDSISGQLKYTIKLKHS